jgi:glucose/arabinose dehydrogenase
MTSTKIFNSTSTFILTFFFSIFHTSAFTQATLDLITSGLERPIFVLGCGDNSKRLFIVEQPGRVKILDLNTNTVLPQPYIDITDRVNSSGNEQGLLGMAFHPKFNDPDPNPNQARFFLHYTNNDGDSVVAEYFAANPESNVADSQTENILLGPIDQPAGNHNGGMIAFHPDESGMLYISLGDGGSGGDPWGPTGNGQNTDTLLGSILRIDVDSTPDEGKQYKIPPDNPFAGGGGAAEIYAYGLRNPWRFSFDSQMVDSTHRLFAGDVGQNRKEEVDIITKGGNYGWRIMEADECFNTSNFSEPLDNCDQTGLILPIHSYGRTSGQSISGGYIYRGGLNPSLFGKYIFGDYGSGAIWILEEISPGVWTKSTFMTGAQSGLLYSLASFGVDDNEELYVCAFDGTDNKDSKIYKILVLPTPTPTATPTPVPTATPEPTPTPNPDGFHVY